MADVVCIHEDKATPQQVLAHALVRAQNGEFRDVVVIATETDGTMRIAWAGCSAEDLAAASLYLQSEAVKQLKI